MLTYCNFYARLSGTMKILQVNGSKKFIVYTGTLRSVKNSVSMKKRNRLGILLVGVFLGTIVGISIMWWGNNFRRYDWISFQKIGEYVKRILPGDEADEALKIPGSGKSSKQGNTYSPDPLDTIPYDAYPDSLTLTDSMNFAMYQELYGEYYIPEESLPDSMQWFGGRKNNLRGNDSLHADSVLMAKGKKEQILRDQFLASRLLTITGKPDSIPHGSQNLDSLLTDDKMTVRPEKQKILVELWKSPVNYKGFKYNGRKLILFGFENFDKLGLEYINRRLLLRNGTSYYAIERTEDFKPFVPVRLKGLVLNTGQR